MDLLEILRSRVAALEEGPYLLGLKAVLQHVEVASRHWTRGQTTDDTAFTDAIYRTNQAFEGSLKEAFRVLADKDPDKRTPFEIENYLQEHSILRSRVLSQFSRYRSEWRNPSTHDYRLDFDENEALLAIVTVAAFAIVLIDQIIERLSYLRAKSEAQPVAICNPTERPLIESVSALICNFLRQFSAEFPHHQFSREAEISGALAGFFASVAPSFSVELEGELGDQRSSADVLLSSAEGRVVVEIKRWKDAGDGYKGRVRDGISQLRRYMEIGGIKNGVLLAFATPNTGKVVHEEHELDGNVGRVSVIYTEPVVG